MKHLVLSSSLQSFSQIILFHCYPQSRKEKKVIQVTPVQLKKKFDLLEATKNGKSCLYNYGHNIMRIFYVLPNFPFTTSEKKPDY